MKPGDRLELGAEMRNLFWDTPAGDGYPDFLALYDRGYTDGQAIVSGREVDASELSRLNGAIVEHVTTYRVVVGADGTWHYMSTEVPARVLVVSEPDPEWEAVQRITSVLNALPSATPERVARAILAAIKEGEGE